MLLKKNIDILSSSEIDKVKWDWIVNNTNNGYIYAQSGFLDQLADDWSALIVGDYEAILPIPFRKKWGIDYAYTPPFMQQLGLIGSTNDIPSLTIKKQIQKKYKYGTVLLNSGNEILARELGALPRANFYLSLQQPFSMLAKNFKKEIVRLSEKRIEENWIYNKTTPIKDCVAVYRQIQGHKLPHVKLRDYEKFIHFGNHNKNPNIQCFSRSVHNPSGELCSVLVLLKDSKRIYNIINASTAEGRKENSNYLLYYECLKEFSNQPLIFDFEGSSIPGIANFYGKFNPLKEYYYLWHYNQLPFPISIFP